MAAVSCATTSVHVFLLNKSLGSANSRVSSPSVVGLPAIQRRGIVCSAEKEEIENKCIAIVGAPLMAAAAYAVSNSVAFALVDERMSTEGTGLSLGLSNPLLGWILVGVFVLIWTLYFTYTSSLGDDDDDSGLSL
eukprot:Gb_40726 [translate_table: standard]